MSLEAKADGTTGLSADRGEVPAIDLADLEHAAAPQTVGWHRE
jgi:hypothetical protein